ncbi:outer membrane lipoprotein-sorting protein [Anseongella ginsenosidimutans]|uniref:Outer membrane lipoprotein-sorting protein n=1 Tax=Anseongella ginsenosidimutans TaxID=496056 RepID=A0A4R3KNR2_9SPHI|nr:outer membrane lipoprotein carrier protein LolA [Anseongella ginsenosidimutans]TCS85456.1 outer membrane lipoprotein-sorting protein [Anseongella ginsenosidimutans]
MLTIAILAAGPLMLFTAHAAWSQPANDPEAKEILDAVSAKYRAHDYIKAVFSYTFNSPSENVTQTEEGSLYVQPGGNKYRVKVAGQEMISNGTTSWVYLPEVNEVQVSDAAAGSGELNPAQLFTLHEKGFKYVLKGESNIDGKQVHLIDLVPLESSPYSKIELAVEKSASLIRQLKVFDKNGNHYIYKIKTINFNPDPDSDFFTFSKADHPGVEVVDLR